MNSERHDDAQQRPVWPPQEGFFHMRLVRKGWPVPCRILCTDAGWQAIIDGEEFPAHADPAHADGVARIWHSGTIVEEGDYCWRLAVKAHAAAHEPDHPALHPRTAIHPLRLKPLY